MRCKILTQRGTALAHLPALLCSALYALIPDLQGQRALRTTACKLTGSDLRAPGQLST